MPEFSAASVRRAVATLVRSTFLLRAGSREAKQDEQLARTWTTWLPQAGFHFATKDTPFFGPAEWPRVAKELIKEPPPPSSSVRRAVRSGAGRRRMRSTLLARKTTGVSGKTVPSTHQRLLYYTWGVTGQVSPTFGRCRTDGPSGGARHPGEVLVALDVRAGPASTTTDTAITCICFVVDGSPAILDSRSARACRQSGGSFPVTASFALDVEVSRRVPIVWSRSTPYLAQTFCLVAAWLGCAVHDRGASRHGVEDALGIDRISGRCSTSWASAAADERRQRGFVSRRRASAASPPSPVRR
jgi:hypothetical protein